MNTSHYTSLELCKKLTEAGFPSTREYNYVVQMIDEKPDTTMIVRPSVMELLDEMPQSVDSRILTIVNDSFNDGDLYWSVSYDHPFTYGQLERTTGHILPDALAEMWIWLKENNYLTFPIG